MRRAAFLFDGFNLYHSLCLAERDSGVGTRWLDLRSVSRSLLHEVGGAATLGSVHYFSALATHIEAIKPGAVTRHQVYMDALRSTGVEIELGRFKSRTWSCPTCAARVVRSEEKESDVAMATRMLDLLWSGACEAVVLVSADSDLTPAVRTARARFPGQSVVVCFPYGRGTYELRNLAERVIRLRKERYAAHQLSDPVIASDGREIRKPVSW